MYYDDKADAKLGGKVKDPIVKAVKWMKGRSQKEKGIMGCAGAAFVSSHPQTALLPYFRIAEWPSKHQLLLHEQLSVCTPQVIKIPFARAGRLE